MLYLYTAIISLALSAALLIVVYTLKNGIPPMPTTRYLCTQTATILARQLLPGPRVIEAGAGWGTLALFLARTFPHLQLLGLENSPLPLSIAKLLRVLLRRENCQFIRQDLYQFDYTGSDAVICYLFAGAMRRLSPLLREQLPHGAIVISIFFALPDWKPLQIVQCNDLYRTKIYVYRLDKLAPHAPFQTIDKNRA